MKIFVDLDNLKIENGKRERIDFEDIKLSDFTMYGITAALAIYQALDDAPENEEGINEATIYLL